jgi:hypothetical protein
MLGDKAGAGKGVRIVEPVECHLRDLTGLDSRDVMGALKTVETYEEDSHLTHKLVRCRRCQQLYFYEFYEEIDWRAGNDPQYRTLIPVADRESAEMLSRLSPFELVAYPAIHMDFPREAQTAQPPYWANRNGWRH